MSSSDPPIAPDVMARRIGDLRAEVAATETRLSKLQAELAWYQDGEKLFGDAPPDPDVVPALPGLAGEPPARKTNGDKPTLRLAILTVMREHPTKTWKTESVIAELTRRDWLPNGANAEHHARSMLAQMHRKGQAKRIERGRYRLPPEPKGGS
jgi:hypothetical protein